jgi:uncharacterized membrane protein
MSGLGDGNSAEAIRAKQGPIVIGLAVIAVLVIAVAGLFFGADPSGVVAAVTTFAGTIGGAYFGVTAGERGKEKAETERKQAQKKVETLLAELPGDRADEVTAKLNAL